MRPTALCRPDLVQILGRDDKDQRAEPVGDRVAVEPANVRLRIGSAVEHDPEHQHTADAKTQTVAADEMVPLVRSPLPQLRHVRLLQPATVISGAGPSPAPGPWSPRRCRATRSPA